MLMTFTDRGALTSAASDSSVQTRALCDVDLGQLFSARWMDAYCIHEVKVCSPTSGTKHKRMTFYLRTT